MQEDVKQRNRLARLAPVDIYISGGNGRFYWPNRLQPADESTPSIRRESNQYIVDSGFGPEGVNQDELIDTVYERDPDYVIPNDTVNTPDVDMRTAVEETAEKVASFLDTIDEQRFPATVLIPLQPPHAFHLAYLHEHYPRQARRGHFALGGMKFLSPDEQVQRITEFRRIIGHNAYVHGFGVGSSRRLIEAIRDHPTLLDSVDFSTPQQHSRTGRVAGVSRVPIYVGPAQGDESATTLGHYITAELCDIARMVTPELTSEEDITVDWEQLDGVDGPDSDNQTEDETDTDSDTQGRPDVASSNHRLSEWTTGR
jgi:hypothetical protein